jgi:hypothetical protein
MGPIAQIAVQHSICAEIAEIEDYALFLAIPHLYVEILQEDEGIRRLRLHYRLK